MKIVDLSHTMSIHTPGWVGYAGNKMYYAQNLQTQGIVAQRIETLLHAGTHFDGAMHATDGRTGDMASLPLDFLVNQGVVVDLSPQVTDWTAITPDMIEKSGAEIREGDILILHTGWHRYYEGQSQQDLVRYFCYHPGPTLATLEWMLKKKIKWFGMDTGSCDHPMNTSIRTMRPDIAREFEQTMGRSPPIISARSSMYTSVQAEKSGRMSFHSTIMRSRKDCCMPRIWAATWIRCSASAASSAPFRGVMKGWNPVPAAFWRSSMRVTVRSRRWAMRRVA